MELKFYNQCSLTEWYIGTSLLRMLSVARGRSGIQKDDSFFITATVNSVVVCYRVAARVSGAQRRLGRAIQVYAAPDKKEDAPGMVA